MDDDDDVHITSEHDRSSDEFPHTLSELSHYYEKSLAPLAYTRPNVWTEDTRPRSVCLGACTIRGSGVTSYTWRHVQVSEWLHRVASKLPNDLGHSGEYTSIQVWQHNGLIPHQDANNLGSSFIIATGNYSGGRLWLQDDDGDQPPPCSEESPPHVRALKGKFVDIQEKFCVFDGTKYHAVEPSKGHRVSFTFFTPQRVHRLSEQAWEDLRELGYPCCNLYNEYGQEPLERAVKLAMNAAQGGIQVKGVQEAFQGDVQGKLPPTFRPFPPHL
eukprot:2087601-Amphidinium_carterae.2